MILKKLLNLQALNLIKKFKKENEEVFDIAIYGSSVKGKLDFNDLDLAILLNKKSSVSKKLKLSQELKSKLKNKVKYELDVKAMDLYDFMDKNFVARQGIIGSGYLLLNKKNISSLFGFESYSIFKYNLKGLTNSKKTLFRYAIGGRNGKGLLELKKGEQLGRGSIKVPLIYEEEFKEFFEKFNINFKILRALCW